MALCHDDLAEVEFYHHSVYSDEYAGDAIFRALARPAGTLPVRTPPWDVALALSHGQREGAKRRRMSDLLTTKDRIAREYSTWWRSGCRHSPLAGGIGRRLGHENNIRRDATAAQQRQVFCAR